MKTTTHLAACAVLLLILVIPLLAQQAGGSGGGEPDPPPAPPGPLADAVFGELVVGDFDDDLSLDAVVLDAGVPTLLQAPEVFRTSVRWDGGVANDLVSIPTANGPDRVLVVGPDGLRELVWDDVDLAWDTQPHGEASWENALALTTGEFDGLPGVDLLGLAEDSSTLLILHGVGDGFVAAPGFPTFAAAHDVLTLDWDGDGTDEIAARTALGVEIYEPNADQVAYWQWTLSDLVLAVIDNPQPEATNERLATIFGAEPGGLQWIRVWDKDGFELVTGLQSRDVYTAVSGDLDGDGDVDIALGIREQPAYTRLTAVQGDPSGKTFPLANVVDVPFGDNGRDPSTNAAGLGFGDFDQDGDVDVLAPAQGAYVSGPAGSAIYSNLHIVDGASPGDDDLRLSILSSQVHHAPQNMFHTLDVTVEGSLLLLPGAQTAELEVVLFKTPDLWEPTETAPHTVLYETLPAFEELRTLSVPLTGAGPDPELHLYSWVIRQVIRDGDRVVALGPASTAVFVSDTNEDEFFFNLLEVEEIQETMGVLPGGSTPPGGGMGVGTSVPDHDEDEAARPR